MRHMQNDFSVHWLRESVRFPSGYGAVSHSSGYNSNFGLLSGAKRPCMREGTAPSHPYCGEATLAKTIGLGRYSAKCRPLHRAMSPLAKSDLSIKTDLRPRGTTEQGHLQERLW